MNTPSPVTLLIVDDEQEIRTGLRSIIPWEEYGIHVIGTSADGSDAWNKIRYYEPDLVITDIQMPGMNGLELIRRSKEEQFHCSFIILSGYDDFQYAKTAIKYGVSDYLLKPISIKELSELIKKLADTVLRRRFVYTDQLSTLSELRNAQISLRQYNLLPQLLQKELTSQELDQSIRDYSLSIRNQESCAVLFKVYSTRQNEEDFHTLSQALTPLKQKLEENLSKTGCLLSDLPFEGLLLVVNLPFSPMEGSPPTLYELLVDLMDRHTASEHTRIVAAIGKPVPSLLDIVFSYQTARQIITWHIYPQIGNLLDCDLLEIKPPAITMPYEGIWEGVLKNDTQTIGTEFHIYLQTLLKTATPPPSFLYGMCNFLIITIQNKVSQYLDGPVQTYTENTFAILQNLFSVEDLESWMVEVLCHLASQLQISRATKSDPLIEKAISYISQNFLHNPHTEDVCHYLGLSKSYFSTYFKQKTQLTFRDYMLNLKIHYAQEQLKHRERKPTEVSLLLGYEDYRSFSRAFKSRTGFSPSDYQSQYHGGEEHTP